MYVRYHLKMDQGIANLTSAEAGKLASEDPDYATGECQGQQLSEGWLNDGACQRKRSPQLISQQFPWRDA
jgi:hypothetical protein